MPEQLCNIKNNSNKNNNNNINGLLIELERNQIYFKTFFQRPLNWLVGKYILAANFWGKWKILCIRNFFENAKIISRKMCLRRNIEK